MNLYCIKCLKFTNYNNTKAKREKDGKKNLYSDYTACGFTKIKTIDKEELSD